MFRLIIIGFLLAIDLTEAQALNFDASRAWAQLLKQCSFGPRDPGSSGHQKCLDYLEGELKKCTPEVERQVFQGKNPVNGKLVRLTNLVAHFQPQNRRRLLLCAHWDTRPWSDQDPNRENRDKPVPGANDGASGVAVLLEIARCLAQQDPGIGVDLTLFDGEDMGREGHLNEYLLGSREYARRLGPPLPQAAILLDMVGDADLFIPQELYSVQAAPRLVQEFFQVALRFHPQVFANRPGNPVYDDHIPLAEVGIPALDLIDFEYDYWHTQEDTPEHCSQASLGAVGEVLLAWIYQRGKP